MNNRKESEYEKELRKNKTVSESVKKFCRDS